LFYRKSKGKCSILHFGSILTNGWEMDIVAWYGQASHMIWVNQIHPSGIWQHLEVLFARNPHNVGANHPTISKALLVNGP
jgi:hypothetical protein